MLPLDKMVKQITVVGDGGVGKTCLLISHKDKMFTEKYVPTIFENFAEEIYVDGNLVNVELMDTAGQEESDRIRLLAYRKTDVFLVCFSVAAEDSYENIVLKWIPELRQHKEDLRIILVGTKADLRDDDETKDRLVLSGKSFVTAKKAEELCKHIKAAKYIETSAKTADRVDEVFEEAARLALQERDFWVESDDKRCCQIL
ncbi:hypothetical protein EB796_014292 [Bugula neritina]|uniref:RHOB n=1 Tax=Bugula neritina TaxID=10212 RepID=A0A7J7JM01_BUGNE|nr:hypothetical protein EB796_014292 [Bugula neritina]